MKVEAKQKTAEIETTDEATDEASEKVTEQEPLGTEEESAQAVTDEDTESNDEVIVTIGDEAPTQEEEGMKTAPEWVKELRKTHREMVKENRELREKLKNLETKAPATVTLGKKPELADFDYDADKFETAITAWYDQKRQAEKQQEQVKESEQHQAREWQAKLDAYGTAKAGLKVKDFEDAEAYVLESFSQVQQGVMIQGAENAAVLIYALGKNPDKAKELASIKDPVKFAFAVAKLEKDLKVKNRKTPPPPERTVGGTAPKSGTVDSTLERLRAEAEKSGDYTKVSAYRKQKRA